MKKGHGRPKGVPNKATREAKVVCNALVDDPVYLKNLRRRMRHGTAGTIETLIWHYAKGKPTERIELGADKSLAYLIAGSRRRLAERRVNEIIAAIRF